MSRDQLKAKMKNGPPLSFVAETLGLSRPTLYRHMENYIAGNDAKVDQYLKEFFDKVVMDQYEDAEQMRKDLLQLREFMVTEKEVKKQEFDDEYRDYDYKLHRFHNLESEMTSKQKVDGQDELDAMYRALCEKAKELEINIDEYSPDDDGPKELKWNEGEIRSTSYSDDKDTIVLIDVDFDKCKDITVEAVLEVSGEEFVLKKVKPQENERFARLDFPMFYRCSGYRLMWIEDGRVKYTPTYPIESP